MHRYALLVLVACGSSNNAPVPATNSTAAKPARYVTVPEATGKVAGLDGPVLVDDGGRLYLIPEAPTTGKVEIPDSATPIALADLPRALAATHGKILLRGGRPYPSETQPVPVVMAPDTPVSRVAEIADVLRASDHCFVPVVTSGGETGAFVDGCRRVYADEDQDERVVMTLLVTNAEYWVALSPINEIQQIPKLASADYDHDKLAVTLAEHKRSAFFSEREDLELVGDPGLEYRSLLQAGGIASRAGFSRIDFVSRGRAKSSPGI
jgi:hypothetical protein